MRAIDNKNDLGNLRKRRYLVKSREYLNGFHRYELKRGETMTGKEEVMTGQEAKLINLALQQEFCEAVRRGKPNGERLELWICKERYI
jgi:hypothetical protein